MVVFGISRLFLYPLSIDYICSSLLGQMVWRHHALVDIYYIFLFSLTSAFGKTTVPLSSRRSAERVLLRGAADVRPQGEPSGHCSRIFSHCFDRPPVRCYSLHRGCGVDIRRRTGRTEWLHPATGGRFLRLRRYAPRSLPSIAARCTCRSSLMISS